MLESQQPPFRPAIMNIQETLNHQGIIHSDPNIMSGTPVFVGTRVPLQTFFDYLDATNISSLPIPAPSPTISPNSKQPSKTLT
jgi:uncharacterized protein (DUF433 family)